MVDREDLEYAAKQAICACFYYDFDPSEMSDDDLWNIIRDPSWPHRQQQIYDPLPDEEVADLLETCPYYPKPGS